MSEQEAGDRGAVDAGRLCPACGKPSAPGDRFCAECGAALASRGVEGTPPSGRGGLGGESRSRGGESDTRHLTPITHHPSPTSESSLWLFGAHPGTVAAGGVLLLVLAAILLVAGQRDGTGTIVMLAICLTPLALITFAIGLARAIGRSAAKARGRD